VAENQEQLQELAENLRIWSTVRKVSGDPYVAQLREDLAEGENLEYWATTDPSAMLPMPIKEQVVKYEIIARLISLVRNVLIFLPVALTWYAIGQATIAFQIYVGSSGTTTANFLDFWQNGYGLLDDKWRIGEIAVLDFYIVMAVIVISLVAGVFQAMATRADALLEATYEEERMELALKISRELAPYRTSTGPSELSSLLREITSAGKYLAETAKRLDKAGASLAKVGQGYKKSTEKVSKSVEKNSKLVSSVSSQIKKSATVTGAISTSLKSISKKISKK